MSKFLLTIAINFRKMARKKAASTPAPATGMTQREMQRLIDQRVEAALAARPNEGVNSNDTNTRTLRSETIVVPQCKYSEFMHCQPTFFKGIEGAIGLMQWFERSETVFHLSECPEESKVKFAAGTLLGDAQTWWKAHVSTIGMEEAHKTTWT